MLRENYTTKPSAHDWLGALLPNTTYTAYTRIVQSQSHPTYTQLGMSSNQDNEDTEHSRLQLIVHKIPLYLFIQSLTKAEN